MVVGKGQEERARSASTSFLPEGTRQEFKVNLVYTVRSSWNRKPVLVALG